MLKTYNLGDAGIADKDDSGRIVDFHSLRHTTGTLLAAAGTHPKVAQAIMRHSGINLTMSRYTHVLTGQEADAVAALPNFKSKVSAEQVATGTDGRTVETPDSAYTPAYKKLTKTTYFEWGVSRFFRTFFYSSFKGHGFSLPATTGGCQILSVYHGFV